MFDFNEENEKEKDLLTELIQDQIKLQKSRLELRKVIQGIIIEISAQVFSAGLAKLMFTFAVDFNFTCGLCIVIASIPSLPTLSKLEFKKTEEGVTIYSMKKPVIVLFKFGVRTLVVSTTLYGLSKEIGDTANNMTFVYNQIKEYETPQVKDFLPPYTFQIVMLSALIVTIGMFLNSLRKRSPFE